MAIDGDLQLSFNGATFGQTGITIEEVNGLDTMPDVRTYDKDRALRHGQFSGRDLMSKRAITVTGNIWGTSAAELRTRIDTLNDACIPTDTELPLVAQLPSYPFTQFYANVRCRKREVVNNIDYGRGDFAPYALLFEATDPRLYETTSRTATTSASTASGGLSFPMTFPLDFGGSGSSGIVAVNNTGNFATPWTATVTGPCTNPQLENLSSGQIVRADLILGASDTLAFNSDLRTVLLNPPPGASRKGAMSADSSWWDFNPGTTSVRFTSASGGSITIQWHSARV